MYDNVIDGTAFSSMMQHWVAYKLVSISVVVIVFIKTYCVGNSLERYIKEEYNIYETVHCLNLYIFAMGFISEPLLFAIALINTGSVLFLLVYFMITLSDLECDYLNAQQCCSKLNAWVTPKLVTHTFLVFLLLIHGQLILTLVNLPMTLWLFYEYFSVPSGNMGVYDPTEIHNRGELKRHTRNCLIYIGYYLIFFFLYLYCMIIALLKGDPVNRNADDLVDF